MKNDVLHSVWFSPMGGPCIGIVVVNTPEGKQAYIGNGVGISETADANRIAAIGSKFPLDAAMVLMGQKN